METITIEKDIPVFYVEATSFPEGIEASHQKLHSLVSFTKDRRYFGISRPENGIIKYKAAAEELKDGEGAEYKCSTLTLKKGRYIYETIHDYLKDIRSIEKTFQKLLTHQDLDPEGYCVEWYVNPKDVTCMIRLRN
jgi:hypothetical protein